LTGGSASVYYSFVNIWAEPLSSPWKCLLLSIMFLGGGVLGGVISCLLTFLPLNLLPSFLLLFACLSVLWGFVLLAKGLILYIMGMD